MVSSLNLTEISACLLETESDAECLRAATELHALLSGIVKLRDDPTSIDLTETQLSEGKALSPRDAARCILDYMRSRSFLRGVRAAVGESQRRFPGQTIHILYAGCGPFAPLVLPLTTQFSSDQVQFTLLDIHLRSLDAVRQIVETLGVSDYVRDYVQCDAASHQNPCQSEPHIILIETMQKALEKEPQVAVTRNLIRLLMKGGILIPAKIKLSACLGNASKEVVPVSVDGVGEPNHNDFRERVDLGTVFELTAQSARQPWSRYSDDSSGSALCSAPVRICVPQIANDAGDLMILTNITVLDSIVLRDYESGLTYPTVLFDLGRIRSNDQLEFQYITGESPGLRWRQVFGVR